MLIMILLLLVVIIIIPATIRMMSDGWDPVIHNNLLAEYAMEMHVQHGHLVCRQTGIT